MPCPDIYKVCLYRLNAEGWVVRRCLEDDTILEETVANIHLSIYYGSMQRDTNEILHA